jgi:hypothetical protein
VNKVRVKVLLNYSNAFMVYEPGDQLLCAATFTLPYLGILNPGAVLGVVWRELNVDDPTEDWAVRYRDSEHRSLSVGDVITIGEQAWTPQPITGWTPCSVQSTQVWYDLGMVESVPKFPPNFAERFSRTYGSAK